MSEENAIAEKSRMVGVHMKGTIHQVRTDDEGESKLTFRVPASNLTEALACAVLARTTLDLYLVPAGTKVDWAPKKKLEGRKR